MGVHRSIVATGRAIRNVGGLKRALVETVRGILVWGWGMRSQSFASSHHLIPRPSTPAIPNVLRGPSHRALTSKSMQRSVDVDGRADLVETWQRSIWGSTSRDQTASPHSHQNRTKQADHPSAKLGIEEAPHHDRLWQIDEAFTPPRLITQVAFLGQSSTLAQEPLSTSHPFDMYRDPYTPLMHMATLLLGLAASCADKGRNPHDFVTTLRD